MEKFENELKNEILLVDKPVGISSYDVIRQLKKQLPHDTKIGHAGTLDPFATGLLIILLNKGTKRFDEFQKMKKEYVVTADFGYETDTLDNTGKVTNEYQESYEDFNRSFKKGAVVEAAQKLTGSFEQIPPQYSAKKVNGRRAYELARKGVEAILKPKEITVYEFELLKLGNVVASKDSLNILFSAEFRIVCSSGCYIRALIRDLGRELGVYGTCTALRRTKIGDFSVEDAENL